MAVKPLKKYQTLAVESAVEVFDYARRMLDQAGNDARGRRDAIHDNGYILIEAPTGAGKTLIAGHVVERMSRLDKVVWFWFAPFKGVVDQTAAALREEFPGLRLRTLSDDRRVEDARAGDVFVTTWQLVATRMKDRRSVRQTGEQNPSVDDMILWLRDQGFRIGVVVDEAHHGFHGDTQAARFFAGILEPEYTVLVTATPDDEDIRDMQDRMHLGKLHRIAVSRADALAQGLIKRGVRCFTWRAETGSEALVDMEDTALREGVRLHRELKRLLAAAGIELTPLLLVQATTTDNVKEIREKLLAQGFTDAQIATHTSDEPDANLLSLANDETREVLIFKMAVALGFDAPRAWALVSMRAAKQVDFGVQLVGRILRVHRRLQGKTVPDELQYGYVLLADIDSQGGIDLAGQRINRIRTEYAAIAPTTAILMINNQTLVQTVGPDGQTSFTPIPRDAPDFADPAGVAAGVPFVPQAGGGLFGAIDEEADTRSRVLRAFSVAPKPTRDDYRLRDGVPRVFKTQIRGEDELISEEECADAFIVSVEQQLDVLEKQKRVRVFKNVREIFSGTFEQPLLDHVPPALDQCALIANRIIRQGGQFDAKVLRSELERRLHLLLAERQVPQADEPEYVKESLDLLLTQYPMLLPEAKRRAIAKRVVVQNAAPLPPTLDTEEDLVQSRLNVYGRMPSGMRSWETQFAEYLDADASGTVLWWHRNESQKEYSVRVILPDGRGFFPDFVVGIRERPTEDHALLADPKERFETSDEIPKIIAEHPTYKRALILAKNDLDQWAPAKLDEHGRAVLGRPFDLADACNFGL